MSCVPVDFRGIADILLISGLRFSHDCESPAPGRDNFLHFIFRRNRTWSKRTRHISGRCRAALTPRSFALRLRSHQPATFTPIWVSSRLCRLFRLRETQLCRSFQHKLNCVLCLDGLVVGLTFPRRGYGMERFRFERGLH